MKHFFALEKAIFGRVMHVTFFLNACNIALGLIQQKRNSKAWESCCFINFDVSCIGPEIFIKIVHAKSEFVAWSRLPSILSFLCRNARHTCS